MAMNLIHNAIDFVRGFHDAAYAAIDPSITDVEYSSAYVNGADAFDYVYGFIAALRGRAIGAFGSCAYESGHDAASRLIMTIKTLTYR